jgi:hypothetical protein
MSSTGSPAKVGEYQSLQSSPFLDVDGLWSNGYRTFSATATSTDDQTSAVNVYAYTPGLSAKVEYQSYLHDLDHESLAPLNLINGPNAVNTAVPPNVAPNPKVVGEDLNLGQDYAIRVQELKSSFKLIASNDLRVRLDVWGMNKDGTRQIDAVAMCYSSTGAPATLPDGHPLVSFPGSKCHVLSQAQHIDWTTIEIKPVVEWKINDSLTLEYSRPMRGFTADDQTTGRYYDETHFPLEGGTTAFAPAGVVPNNTTQMDQLKVSSQLTDNTKGYAYLMTGSTTDQDLDMTRLFNNMDFRLTNTAIPNTSLTAYGTVYNEVETEPTAAAVQAINQGGNATLGEITNGLLEPIDYHKTTIGVKGSWRPWGGGFDQGGLAIMAGYEYGNLDRTNALYTAVPVVPVPGEPFTVVLDESHTITNSFQIGPDYRWNETLDTFVRYKYQHADQPLIGFTFSNGVFNTLLPQEDHIVEVGFNWVPADWFILNASVGIEESWNHSSPASTDFTSQTSINFNEQNFPVTLGLWYAASKKLSFSAGYSIFSNFVAQNVVIGNDPAPYSAVTGTVAPITSPWNYSGRSQVVTLGSRYRASENVTLTGEFEWVRGLDEITNSSTFFPATGATITDLGGYSTVSNTTTRVRLGADWKLGPRIGTYFRYELYNFDDIAPGYQTGLAQGVLGGFSATY